MLYQNKITPFFNHVGGASIAVDGSGDGNSVRSSTNSGKGTFGKGADGADEGGLRRDPPSKGGGGKGSHTHYDPAFAAEMAKAKSQQTASTYMFCSLPHGIVRHGCGVCVILVQ